MTDRPALLLVTGAYGSGTTAMAGALAHLGLPAPQPFYCTNDERTPVSYEAEIFRGLIKQLVDEETLALRPLPNLDRLEACRKLVPQLAPHVQGAYAPDLPFLLKSPAALLCLPWLAETFALSIILMHRRFAEIEQTRLRRQWPAQFGAGGARTLYSAAFRDMIDHALGWTAVSYEELCTRPAETLSLIIRQNRLEKLEDRLAPAAAFIRR